MKCESLQFDLPLYLDDVLSDDQREAIESHLPTCPLCRVKLDEHRSLKNDLRMIPAPVIPADLMQSVRSSVAAKINAPTIHLESPPQKSLREVISYWLMPYSVGTVGALVFTFALLTNLGSTKNAADLIASKANTTEETTLLANSNADEVLQEFDLPNEYPRIALEGNTPKINPKGALELLTKSIFRGEMEDDEVVLIADVFRDGIAKISKMVDPPNNKRALRELEKAFETDPEKAPFLPPKLEADSQAVRVVLKIQRVDVKTTLRKK